MAYCHAVIFVFLRCGGTSNYFLKGECLPRCRSPPYAPKIWNPETYQIFGGLTVVKKCFYIAFHKNFFNPPSGSAVYLLLLAPESDGRGATAWPQLSVGKSCWKCCAWDGTTPVIIWHMSSTSLIRRSAATWRFLPARIPLKACGAVMAAGSKLRKDTISTEKHLLSSRPHSFRGWEISWTETTSLSSTVSCFSLLFDITHPLHLGKQWDKFLLIISMQVRLCCGIALDT